MLCAREGVDQLLLEREATGAQRGREELHPLLHQLREIVELCAHTTRTPQSYDHFLRIIVEIWLWRQVA